MNFKLSAFGIKMSARTRVHNFSKILYYGGFFKKNKNLYLTDNESDLFWSIYHLDKSKKQHQ